MFSDTSWQMYYWFICPSFSLLFYFLSLSSFILSLSPLLFSFSLLFYSLSLSSFILFLSLLLFSFSLLFYSLSLSSFILFLSPLLFSFSLLFYSLSLSSFILFLSPLLFSFSLLFYSLSLSSFILFLSPLLFSFSLFFYSLSLCSFILFLSPLLLLSPTCSMQTNIDLQHIAFEWRIHFTTQCTCTSTSTSQVKDEHTTTLRQRIRWIPVCKCPLDLVRESLYKICTTNSVPISGSCLPWIRAYTHTVHSHLTCVLHILQVSVQTQATINLPGWKETNTIHSPFKTTTLEYWLAS